MAWVVNSRHQRSIAFVDDANPQKRAIDASISPLHYQSVLDSGSYDAPINLSPVRIQNAQLDGWRVTANDWHYALGQPGNKATDGWIGFGGRQGQHWLMARLFRLGYIRWSDKLWTDVGGAPDYNRSNLSQETHIWTCPTNGEQFTLSTAATWANIWQAPGGGVVDAAWKAHPLGLKEHIYINQAGRDYIASQWPGGSTTARYFSLAFQVDALNIPRWKLGSILQQSIDDVDNESAAVITGETAAGQLLFSLPLDWAWVEDANGEEIAGSRIPLRKRLYLENGQYILLVGARVDQLNALPSGTLVLDPTIDTQVGAGADDGRVYQDTADYSNADTNTYVGWSHPSNGVSDAWARFTGISGLGGSTIDVAYYSVEGVAKQGTPLTKIYAEDAAAPTAPTSLSDYNGRSRTAAAVDWDNPGTWTNSGFNDSPSIVSVIQELADSYDPSAIQILHEDDGSATGSNNRLVYSSYDAGSTLAPKLHIEYTAAGGAFTLTAEAGSFSLAGQATGLRASRQLAAAVGTLALTGQATVLQAARQLTAAPGTFALTGQAATLQATRQLVASVATFVLTGQTVNLRVSRQLAAVPGTFTLSGQAASLRTARQLAAGQGTFTLTGIDATLTGPGGAFTLTAEFGSYALSGQAAALRHGANLAAGQGSFALSGQAAGLTAGRRLTAGAGSFVLTGQDATLTGPEGVFTLTAEFGAFVLAGQTAGLVHAARLAAGVGSFALSGQAAGLRPGRVLSASAGSFTLTGQDVLFLAARVLTAARGTFTLTGQPVLLVYSAVETPDNRTYTITATSRIYIITAESRVYSI